MDPVQCFEWMVMSVVIHFMILLVTALGVLLPIVLVLFLIWSLIKVIQKRTPSSEIESRELPYQPKPIENASYINEKLPWKPLISFLLVPFLTMFISAQKACPAALQASEADTGGFLNDGDILITGAGWKALFLSAVSF